MADQSESNAGAQGREDVAPSETLNKAQWLEAARTRFNVSPHAMAGALYGHEDDAELDADSVRDLLDQFSVRRGV